MAELKQASFKLKSFHIDEFNIKRKPLKSGKVNFDIEPQGVIMPKNGSYLLQLSVIVKDDNNAFDIKLSALGTFLYNKEDPESELGNFFYLNAPAIIFPYIRSFVASVTALSGLEAIHLPLINFPKVISEKLKNNTRVIPDKSPPKPKQAHT